MELNSSINFRSTGLTPARGVSPAGGGSTAATSGSTGMSSDVLVSGSAPVSSVSGDAGAAITAAEVRLAAAHFSAIG